jgi:hypothetical protein
VKAVGSVSLRDFWTPVKYAITERKTYTVAMRKKENELTDHRIMLPGHVRSYSGIILVISLPLKEIAISLRAGFSRADHGKTSPGFGCTVAMLSILVTGDPLTWIGSQKIQDPLKLAREMQDAYTFHIWPDCEGHSQE